MAHLASTLNIPETLFTTNQVPSDEDSKAIDAKLAQLREEQSSLTLRLTRIEAMIACLKPIRHPIRYVPDDILGRIFEYVAPWSIAEDSFPPPDVSGELGAPWILSHVCQNWRAVCLSLPNLWSAFRVPFGKQDASRSPWFAEKMDTVYWRSEPLPLRLCVDDVSTASLPVLLKSTHRWRCIRFTSRRPSGCSQADIFHNRLFPILSHLSLIREDDSTPTNILAPSLRNLELIQTSVHCKLVVPWEQIVWHKSTNSDIEFVGYMKNLEELVMVGNYCYTEDNDNDVQDTRRITLPKVRRLEFDNRPVRYGISFPYRLFNQYHFDSLRTLIIDICDPSPCITFAFSLPSVIELSLWFQQDAAATKDVLLATPNVQSLHLQSKYGTSGLLMRPYNRFPVLGQPPSLASLHHLRHLLLTIPESGSLYIRGLHEVVTALKMDYGLPLETVSFYGGLLDVGRSMTESK
ncbi:hypothetical protein CYLTODRAFT_457333 [Cylindrobasidium torrendii FP15055 ss-10]|uniref:F-box domain-containing protein n=1 Tax=Cylindrobasidium torrendii FP15055 ss-10 TaxID=1314674 RepID=A0A0D7B462_9AGAR|nr:hypothetical protein CYLTODRAFT_457333 [Cylindrobasidium torrendii FP15055 ss-10]